ncbi:glycosyltransferase family 50 protein [Serendipita vermifera MAFF 305830]|uniref:GPI mannosyltransferase 1 n=1 Tax=Serendipita vermifera MAFF 305830 TaxID=933852 RepID=A0A0C2W5C4_SERVB|nr:glycosyltransferase family 50 protein [Serendipita vermifera MAFF 305830]
MPSVSSTSAQPPANPLSKLRFVHIVALSLVVRLALIVYAEYHDAHSVLKYTDVDYRVFSDAARFTLNPSDGNYARGSLGRDIPLGDPYTRATYRYTPLLALLLAPNEWIHPTFGKILFSLSDVLIGILLRRLQTAPSKGSHTALRGSPSSKWIARGLNRDEIVLTVIWMLNPLPANISTRGSAESLLGLMVIATLYFALQKRWTLCATLLGLSIHWKIYPIIYLSSLIPLVGAEDDDFHQIGLQYWIKWCTNRKRLQFAATTIFSFGVLSALMYLIWGYPFLQHSYLYHVGRTDHRHNFSVYFYPLYLGLVRQRPDGFIEAQSKLLSPAAFLPQVIISIGGGFYLAWSLLDGQIQKASQKTQGKEDPASSTLASDRSSKAVSIAQHQSLEHLPFIFLVQTFTFVTLNKVCTSQYFMWYLWFLPLVIPRLLPVPGAATGISVTRCIAMVVLWVGGQALWLSQGFRLEFLGEDVFLELWVSGLVMLGINAWLIVTLVQRYNWQ